MPVMTKLMIGILVLGAGCGSVPPADTTTAHFGWRCFEDELTEQQCDVAPGDWFGTELECRPFNAEWADYFLWAKTGSLCSGPRFPTK